MGFPFEAFKNRKGILDYVSLNEDKYGHSRLIFRGTQGDITIPKIYLLYFKFPLLEIVIGD